MLRSLLASRKSIVRFVAWGSAIALLWAIWQDAAFAQGSIGAVEEEGAGFWGELVANIFNSRRLMETLGKPHYAIPAFIALNLIVFIETGLLVGFFLPGDSLLVIVGLICANEHCAWSMPLLLVTLSLSAIIGDTVGYWIGYKTGPKLFNREKSIFFAKDHLLKAQDFYQKHGGKTIILARFIPFLRTFAPVVAGIGKMEYRQFLFFNIVGGIGWVFSMVLAGRYLPALLNPLLQRFFGAGFLIQDHVEKVVMLVVFLSIAPGIYAWIRSKMAAKPVSPMADDAHSREVALSAK
jgi:membrane-associated protein